MIGNVGATGPGVLKEFRDIRKQIGKNVEKTSGVTPRALSQETDPQFPRSQLSVKRLRKMKQMLAEKRQTTRPIPSISSRPANQRPNTGAIDQNYARSGALVEDRRAGKRMGKDAGAGPK